MKTKLNVAILMPVYNGGDKLFKAIQSVLDQTYPLEYMKLFIVDNRSTDTAISDLKRKFEIISGEFTPTHPLPHKFLFCKEPGIVPALNTGVFAIMAEKEHFDVIARLDADDMWMPEKIEKQVQFMIDNPQVSVLGTNILQIDPQGNELSVFTYPQTDSQIKEMLLTGRNAIAHPSVMFRPEVLLRTGGYDNTYPIAEDYHLWLKAAKWFDMANLNEVLIKYTVSHNPQYNPLTPQMACMAMKQAYHRLHG